MRNCEMMIDLYHPKLSFISNTFSYIGGSYDYYSGPNSIFYLNIEEDS
jgi:hypothetical protein